MIILWEGNSPASDASHSRFRLKVRKLMARFADGGVSNMRAGVEYLNTVIGMSHSKLLHHPYEVPDFSVLCSSEATFSVQEYGRYFGMKTACFRGGCLTGPNHSGVQLHGFLAYLMKCAVTDTPYSIFGYKKKQVRDNIHSVDSFVSSTNSSRTLALQRSTTSAAASNCSMLEAIALCENITGKNLRSRCVEENRSVDHIWWISDFLHFAEHYPGWRLQYDVPRILREIYECNLERWSEKCLTLASEMSSGS